MADEYKPKFGKQNKGGLTEKLAENVCYGPDVEVIIPVSLPEMDEEEDD